MDKCPICGASNSRDFIEDSQLKHECRNCNIIFWFSENRIHMEGKGMPPDGSPD